MKFRKKPVVIEAEPYREGLEDGWNCYEVISGKFLGYYKNGVPYPRSKRVPVIETLEGNHEITPTDWIVTGIKGERYPVKKDIFTLTYEPVESEEFKESRIEKLSEEVHNAWMKEKIEQGFHAPVSHGGSVSVDHILTTEEEIKEYLDEIKFTKHCVKCHTNLYPYTELPECIQEVRRAHVKNVISAMEKLGF